MTTTLNGHTLSRADVTTLRQVLHVLDHEIAEQELHGADDEELCDLTNAAEDLRELLRRFGEPL